MRVNLAKFQMMFLGLKICFSFCLKIYGQKVKQSEYIKFLDIQIYKKLHFDMHLTELDQEVN